MACRLESVSSNRAPRTLTLRRPRSGHHRRRVLRNIPAPAAALQSAWAIRSAVEEHGLLIRTGLHLPDCVIRGEMYSGLAIHISARVMNAAGDGEILVTDAVREAVPAVMDRLADHGRHELKGV